MVGLGVAELLILLALVIFVFGWGRLPQLGSDLRQAVRNYRSTAQGDDQIDITPAATDDAKGKESHHARKRGG